MTAPRRPLRIPAAIAVTVLASGGALAPLVAVGCEGGKSPPADATSDDGGGGFQCIDDSTFGQNDTTAGAFPTPVASSSSMFAAFAAICPERDKDHYSVNVVAGGTNIEVITSWDSGQAVNVSFLNAGGVVIGNGSPMGDNALRVCVPNLPIGMYFVATFATASVQNNYGLEIKSVPSC